MAFVLYANVYQFCTPLLFLNVTQHYNINYTDVMLLEVGKNVTLCKADESLDNFVDLVISCQIHLR